MEFVTASENKRIILPNNKQEKICTCCLEEEKIMRDKMGTAIPTKAIGPQKAVVNPVSKDEIKMR